MASPSDKDDSRIYDLSPPPAPAPPEASGEEAEPLPLPIISAVPPELAPAPDTAPHIQLVYGCLCSWAAGALIFASTFAPRVVMIFLISALVLAFVGCIQWGVKLQTERHWRHFLPGMAFG